MPRFVMKKIHARQRTGTSSQDGKEQEAEFGYPPILPFGFLLVDTEQDKRQEVEQEQVADDELIGHSDD